MRIVMRLFPDGCTLLHRPPLRHGSLRKNQIAALFPEINTFMASPLTSRTCDELPATTGKLYWHVPMLVWNVRVRSGDLPSLGAQRQHGARVRRVRGTQQLSGARHSA